MDNVNQNAFASWLQEKIEACRTEAGILEQDDRRDEAVFAKVRLNVYDIFRTVYAAASNNGGDPFFLARLDQIPQNWQISLEQAHRHGGSRKAHIETIKLEAAREIRAAFEKMKEASV